MYPGAGLLQQAAQIDRRRSAADDGDVTVFAEGKEKKILAEMNMGSSVYATPVPAHGTLFLNNRNELYALAEGVAAH